MIELIILVFIRIYIFKQQTLLLLKLWVGKTELWKSLCPCHLGLQLFHRQPQHGRCSSADSLSQPVENRVNHIIRMIRPCHSKGIYDRTNKRKGLINKKIITLITDQEITIEVEIPKKLSIQSHTPVPAWFLFTIRRV